MEEEEDLVDGSSFILITAVFSAALGGEIIGQAM
jgi:hypothetical protein